MNDSPGPPAIARVSRLAVTAVKGFGVQEVEALDVTEDGVPGDRAFFVVDEKDKLLSATRTACFLPFWSRFDVRSGVLGIGRGDTVLVSEEAGRGMPVRSHFFGQRYADGHLVPGPWHDALSEIAGRRVRLVRADDPLGGYDLHRITLVSEASVAALGEEPDGSAVDLRRFRMTITVDGVPPFAEDGWQDRSLAVGGCVVRVGGPVKRCATVQRHPDGLEGTAAGVNTLQRIKRVRGVGSSELGRGLNLGVYGEVELPGAVRVGDAVRASGVPVPS